MVDGSGDIWRGLPLKQGSSMSCPVFCATTRPPCCVGTRGLLEYGWVWGNDGIDARRVHVTPTKVIEARGGEILVEFMVYESSVVH